MNVVVLVNAEVVMHVQSVDDHGCRSIATMDNVDIVDLNVNELIHVEVVVQVVRCQPINLVNPGTH